VSNSINESFSSYDNKHFFGIGSKLKELEENAVSKVLDFFCI